MNNARERLSLRLFPLLIAYWFINTISNNSQCMRREQACRLPGTTVPWANLYRCNIYTGSTVYTTYVMCRARLYQVMQLIRLLIPVPYLARYYMVTYTQISDMPPVCRQRLGRLYRGLTTDGIYPRIQVEWYGITRGIFPFGQLLAIPFIPGKDRFPTLGTQRLRYKFNDSRGNTGYATANTGNLLSVLSRI